MKDLDRPMSRLSVMPDTVGPSSNELRLGRKVLDLEKERDSLAVSRSGYPRGGVLMPGRAESYKSEICPFDLDDCSRPSRPTRGEDRDPACSLTHSGRHAPSYLGIDKG